MMNEVIEWQEAHLIWWRKAIKDYFLRNYEINIEFFPKMEGEEDED